MAYGNQHQTVWHSREDAVLDGWRRKQPNLPTRGAAIRSLAVAALLAGLKVRPATRGVSLITDAEMKALGIDPEPVADTDPEIEKAPPG